MPFIIWIIGWLFTAGVAIDPSDKSAKWLIPLSAVAWPLLLGCWVKSVLSNVTPDHSQGGRPRPSWDMVKEVVGVSPSESLQAHRPPSSSPGKAYHRRTEGCSETGSWPRKGGSPAARL